VRNIFACVVAAVLGGCSATQLPSGQTAVTYAVPDPSWIAHKAQSEDLLYISDQGGRVYVFTYPGGERVGMLTRFRALGGLCSDSNGDVFVVDTARQAVLQYSHGATRPTHVFGASGYPQGCAVDPTTGNLAVADYQAAQPPGPGNVLVYNRMKNMRSTIYTDPSFNQFFFCGYDGRGNLYVDGVNAGTSQSEFAELPKGATSLRDFKLNERIAYPGAIQWDGTDLAVEDLSSDVIYRVRVAASSGRVVGSTHLDGDHSTLLTQFWIQNNVIISPYGKLPRSVHRAGLWPYPSGGSPKKVLEPRGDVELLGATISVHQ